MSDPFLGEIRMFAGTFPPRGWAFCDGQLLAISQNDALFALLGTIYGGDGRTTFALPEMRGRIPIHMGSGPGLTPRNIGSRSGSETVTLNVNELPQHTHQLQADSSPANEHIPGGNALGSAAVYAPNPPGENMSGAAIGNRGGSQAHSNLQPFLCVNFIIALVGIFPSRA
jgi:microcystin-dependent protein